MEITIRIIKYVCIKSAKKSELKYRNIEESHLPFFAKDLNTGDIYNISDILYIDLDGNRKHLNGIYNSFDEHISIINDEQLNEYFIPLSEYRDSKINEILNG